jgi:hypothetical protein
VILHQNKTAHTFPGVQYPRIEADSRATFHFKAPNAQEVQVSIVNVPFDMVKGDDGVWTYTSEPQAPDLSLDTGGVREQRPAALQYLMTEARLNYTKAIKNHIRGLRAHGY